MRARRGSRGVARRSCFLTLRAFPRTTRLSTSGGTIPRIAQKGLNSTPATTASRSPAEDRQPDHPPRVVLDLRDVDVLGEPLEDAPVAPALALLAHRQEQGVDLLAPLRSVLLRRERDEVSQAGDESPVFAKAQERPHHEDAEPDDERDDQWDQEPGLEEPAPESRLVRSRRPGGRALVRERHRLGAHDGDLHVDVLVGLRGRAVPEQVLVRELEAELVVDLGERVAATSRRRTTRRSGRRSSRGRRA